jgi:hypothetical protein
MQTKTIQVMHTVSTMTLSNFIEVVCENNFDVMVKEGEATEVEKKKAWDAVYVDYFELISSTDEYKTYLQKYKDYGDAISRYQVLIMAFSSLGNGYNKDAQDALHSLGYFLNFDVEDFELYSAELKKLQNHIKNTVSMLHNAHEELNRYTSKQKKQIKQADYLKYIASVSQFVGHSISHQITLKEWAGYINIYNHGRR